MTYVDPLGYSWNWYTIAHGLLLSGEGILLSAGAVAAIEIPPLAFLAGGLAGNDFAGAYANFKAGIGGQPVQPTPLDSLMGSQATEGLSFSTSVIIAPESAAGELLKTTATHVIDNGLDQMSQNYSSGGGAGAPRGMATGGMDLIDLMSAMTGVTPSLDSGPGLYPGTSMVYFSGVLAGYDYTGGSTAILHVKMSDGQTAIVVVSQSGQVISAEFNGGALGTVIWGTEASMRDK